MAKVFFSYSRKDKEAVKKVEHYLEKNGHDIWLDEDISAGVPFPQAIEVAIKSCDFMAIFLSKNSKDSSWVKREFNAYFLKDVEKNKNTIIPILLDETHIDEFSIFLTQLQICNISNPEDYQTELQKVLELIEKSNIPSRTYSVDDYNRLMFAIDMAVTAGYTTMTYYNSGLRSNIILDKDVKNAATLADEAAEDKISPLIKLRYPHDKIISEEANKKDIEVNIGDDHYYWIIDPLDGTLNFLNRIDLFCSAIGLIRNGEPYMGVVFNPVSNEVFFGMNGMQSQVWRVTTGEVNAIYSTQTITSLEESLIGTHVSSRESAAKKMFERKLIEKFSKRFRHIRLLGCGQLALAFVASGKLQAFFQFDSYIWDQLAGAVILQNAGGIVRDFDEENSALVPWQYTTKNILACSNNEIAEKFQKFII